MAREREGPTNSKDQHPIRAQIIFKGNEFTRRLPVNAGVPKATFPQTRFVIIVGELNESDGTIGFRKVTDMPKVYPMDLPHKPLSEANAMHNKGEVKGSSLRTVRKRGASISGIDVEEGYKNRGGTGKKVPKPSSSFMFGATPRELYKQSKRVTREERRKRKQNSEPLKPRRRLIQLYEYKASPN